MFFGMFSEIFFGDSSAVVSPGAEWGRAMTWQESGRFSYAAKPRTSKKMPGFRWDIKRIKPTVARSR